MLTKNSFMTSVGLCQDFARRGMTISAKPNTVISELMRTMSLVFMDNLVESVGVSAAGDEMEYAWRAERLERVTSGTLEQPTQHSLYMDSVVEDIKKAVLNHISFAKNVVKPIVCDYAEQVQIALQEQAVPEPSAQFEIKVVDVPTLLLDSQFQGLLDFYKGKPPIAPEGPLPLSVKSPEEIFALMQTGDKDLDGQLAAWFAQVDHEFILDIWESFFLSGNSSRQMFYRSEDAVNMNQFDRISAGLILFLAGTKLFDNVDEAAQGIDLNAYKNLAAQARDFGGGLLSLSIGRLESMKKAGSLIVQIDQAKKQVIVYGEVYRQWLETGGKPEILYGLIVSRRKPVTTVALIDQVKDDYMAEWKNYCLFQSANELNHKFNLFKDILTLKFKALLNDLTAEEQEFIQTNSGYHEKIAQYLTEELDKLKMDDMKNVHKVAMTIICRTRFYYTDAERILGDIQEAAETNPNIRDVREAALVATLQYVADYVADQLTVKTV